MKISYEKIWPFQTIEGNCIVNGHGDVTKVFEVTLPEVFSKGRADYTDIHNTITNLTKTFKVNAHFHACEMVWPAPFEPGDIPNNYSVKKDLGSWAMKPVGNHKTYWALSLTDKSPKFTRYFMRNPLVALSHFVFKKPFKDFERLLPGYEKAFEAFKNGFNGLHGIKLRELSTTEIAKVIRQYITFTFDDDTINWEDPIDPICAKDGNMMIGNKYYRFLSLFKQGQAVYSSAKNRDGSAKALGFDSGNAAQRKLEVSYPYPLVLGFPEKHIYNISFEVVDNKEYESHLLTEKRNVNPLTFFGIRMAKNMQDETDSFVDSLSKSDAQGAKIWMDVILADENLDKLNTVTGIAKNAFNALDGAVAKVENEETLAQFNASMFGARRYLTHWKKGITEHAVCLINKESYPKGDPYGFYYLDSFGKPVQVNFTDNPLVTNRHKVIVGRSGSGKTFWALGYIDRCFHLGYHIIVIDVKHDYKRLCNNLGGVYYDSDNLRSMSMNIFRMPKGMNDEERESHINVVYSILKLIWKGKDKIENTEATVLNDLVTKYYDYIDGNGKDTNKATFYGFIDVYEKKVITALERKYFDFAGFKLTVKPFIDGKFDYIFDDNEQLLKGKNRLTVFSLKSVVDHPLLFPIYAIMIGNLNVQMMQNLPQSIRKMFAIDEAWKAFRGDLAEVAEYNFRVARSLNGEIAIMTQYASDIEESGIAGAIKGNAETKILFRQKKEDFTMVRQVMQLTSHDLELLDNVKQHEFFLKMGDDYSTILTNKVSPHTVALYETNADKVENIERHIAAAGGDVELGINEYVNETAGA